MYNNVQEMIRNGYNPQQIVTTILQQQNNPMAMNLLTLARNGNFQEIEKIARNVAASQGKDYDKEFQAFKSQLGLK